MKNPHHRPAAVTFRPRKHHRAGSAILSAVCAAIAALAPASLRAETEGGVDYATVIAPMLEASCYSCHGPDKQKGMLRLDARSTALDGGLSGLAIVPGESAESLLYIRAAGLGDEEQMPPGEREKLSGEQLEQLRRWIDQGADWPESGEEEPAEIKKHWAFVKPRRPTPPAVSDDAPVRNPIDRFIQARLEAEGIAPSPEADPRTLIRRASLDLTGLPPTADEIEIFLADRAPDAWDRLIDRLLASPHYGERQARRWLDAARYADSNGYSIDGPRDIWMFRDWVIDAINADMPFDRFTLAQLAGDLLPDATDSDRIATGFHRNTMINQEGGVDPEEFRIESVIDRVNTTGTVFLGVTIECAQCHNHKFDPFTQKEYYRLFAFFNDDDEPTLNLPTPEQTEARENHKKTGKFHELRLDSARAKAVARTAEEWIETIGEEKWEAVPEEARHAISVLPDCRTDEQAKLVGETAEEHDTATRRAKKTLDSHNKRRPEINNTMVLRRRKEPRETRLHIAGDFTRPGDIVTPGVPSVLHDLPDADEDEVLTRLDLARWIASPENPLTARVAVNRMWQDLFGRGLVETDNDFGTQGSPPTHPALLDWLAAEFVESGWSRKHMLRLITGSAAYRRSSHARPDLALPDPDNRLLARQNRVRLDSEIVRDSALAASGLLTRTFGGPGVFPPQPDGVMNLGQSNRAWITSKGEDRYRRGIYTYIWRVTPHPLLTVFDTPSAIMTCTRRNRSNTPLQALTLLNDEAFAEFAQELAARIIHETARGGGDDAARINRLFEICLARRPDESEVAALGKLIELRREQFADDPDAALAMLAEFADKENPAGPGAARERAAWTDAARVVLNLDEFITRE